MDKYQPSVIEPKWEKVWEKHKLYQTVDFDKKRPKKYLLVEFPYPSGEGLHIGHAFTNTILDVLARKKRMEGFNVLHPMGWDAFGLPTENYAIKMGIHPATVTKRNTKRFHRQNDRLAVSYDWDREIDTTYPAYYKWTQWIFIQLFKHGLAYKAERPVGWCPSCKIVLANEEIVGGKCERCGAEAQRRQQAQWLLRITAYADRLADDLDDVDYPNYVKAAQRHWIGRSKGTEILFPLETTLRVGESREAGGKTLRVDEITVFTTRPDTLFGATAMVLAPEHPLIQFLLLSSGSSGSSVRAVRQYVEASRRKSELERTELAKEKTGVFTGLYCQNPINGEKVPIWVGDYVIASYGGGAVMVVPAHDQRDFEFAQKYHLPIKIVISPKFPPAKRDPAPRDKSPKLPKVFEEDGILVNSGQFTGFSSAQARRKITAYLERRGLGKATVSYHLRDWIFSRQHYWGEPIPMIFCPTCAKKGIIWFDLPEAEKYKNKIRNLKLEIRNSAQRAAGWFPLPEDQLPLKLPKVEKYQPTDTGESPLANVKDWVKATCSHCKGPARRETDTMPNWAGSSWYYLAYPIAGKLRHSKFQNIFTANKNILAYWMPVDLYLGGAEHTTLHLLYSRFWHKFLFDIGMVPGKEPYAARRQHGDILAEDGSRMSKSKGNVINPEEVIKEYGADTLRVYLMFMGPYEETMPWNTKGVEGAYRFLHRVWRLVLSSTSGAESGEETSEVARSASCEVEVLASGLKSSLHRLIKKVGEDIDSLKYNTAIAAMMEFLNEVQAQINTDPPNRRTDSHGLSKKDWGIFLLLLAPFAPFMTEELWFRISSFSDQPDFPDSSIHLQPWPRFDPKLVKQEKVTVVIQVNGKFRDRLEVAPEVAKDKKKVMALALASPKIQKHLPAGPISPISSKTIFVSGRLINFVVS